MFFSLQASIIKSKEGGDLLSRVQTINEIKGKLTPIFDAYGVRSAILFGSVAKGTSTEKSDIDLLVDSRLKGLRFVGLIEDVRRATQMPVDLLDVSHIEKGSPIDREIRSTGVTIYEK